MSRRRRFAEVAFFVAVFTDRNTANLATVAAYGKMSAMPNPYNAIEDQVILGLDAAANNLRGKKVGNACWTVEIKRLLLCVAPTNYTVCASGCKNAEYLYDVCWMETAQGGKSILQVHMVLESEWGDDLEIMYDFRKLLIARATSRVMVFQGDGRQQNIISQAKAEVLQFKGTQQNDRYLFACWSDQDQNFRYDLFVVP